jgi:hypothetical protein
MHRVRWEGFQPAARLAHSMRASRCPRCTTLVRYLDGHLPTCPICGYPKIAGDHPADAPDRSQETHPTLSGGATPTMLTPTGGATVLPSDELLFDARHATAEASAPSQAGAPAPPHATARLMAPHWQAAPVDAPAPSAARPYAPGGHQTVRPTASGKAIASLILGIASYVLALGGIVTAIPAIVLGILARQDIARSPNTQTGNGMATTGMVLGILALVIAPLITWLIYVRDVTASLWGA